MMEGAGMEGAGGGAVVASTVQEMPVGRPGRFGPATEMEPVRIAFDPFFGRRDADVAVVAPDPGIRGDGFGGFFFLHRLLHCASATMTAFAPSRPFR